MPTKQKSGLYRTKIKIGVDQNGKDINKWISGKTKRELEAARREVEERYIGGLGLRDDMLFAKYAIKWYHDIKEPSLSPSSRASYRSMFNKYVLPEFGEQNLRAITASDIQRWLNTFAGKSDTTIALAATVVRNVFGAALADRIILSDPAGHLSLPKAAKEAVRRGLTPEENNKVLNLIATHKHGAYLACMYYLGLRPGEVRGLMWGDFNWESELVSISRDIDYADKAQAGALKTDAAERLVPIPVPLKNILYPMRGLPGAYVFVGVQSGRPLSKSTAERMWLEMMEDAGLYTHRESTWEHPDIRSRIAPTITPYYLRHNYITMCWAAGLDPMVTMRIVGHTDYRTTINIYTHLNDDHLQRASDKLHEIFDARKVAQKLHNAAFDHLPKK